MSSAVGNAAAEGRVASETATVHDQSGFDVRFDWGEDGAERLAASDTLVIVDVLSFCTAVDVAVERGAIVYPYGFRGKTAAAFARKIGACLAAYRTQGSPGHSYSLSPASLRAIAPGTRLVLPSPNGPQSRPSPQGWGDHYSLAVYGTLLLSPGPR